MDCEIFIRTVGAEDDVLEWLQTALSSYLSVLVTLYLIPALKGRGCGVGYQKEVRNRAEKRGTLPIKAICANYSCSSFAFLSLLTPFSPPGFFPSFFIQRWSKSSVFIPSIHFPFPHSTMAVCFFRMFTSSHPFHTPHPSLYKLMSFSWGLHFPCSQILVYPHLFSSPYLLHASICCFFSWTVLLHFSHHIIQLPLAFSTSN